MKITDHAINVLAAKTYRGIGRAWIVRNLSGNETANRIVALLNEGAKHEQPITEGDFENARALIAATIKKQAPFSDGAIAIGDVGFPPHRGNVKNSDQPVVLFYCGDLRLLSKSSRNIAVIGLTTPDKKTEEVESEMVAKLVNYEATIVSGLALGCDAVAHRQALRSNGKTVAVLPSPLNAILPFENRNLAHEIASNGGLLITEYYDEPNSKRELGGRYQERDRLQALYSDCVILAASYAKNDIGLDSGARLAMEYAKSYSIRRAVMYDNARDAENPKYGLNRQLIREQDGILVINPENMASILIDLARAQSQPSPHPVGQADLFR